MLYLVLACVATIAPQFNKDFRFIESFKTHVEYDSAVVSYEGAGDYIILKHKPSDDILAYIPKQQCTLTFTGK